MIGGLVYGFMAFMILPIYAALDRMDPALIEAGKDLYGGPWQTFRNVTLAAHDPGRAGRLRCSCSCRRSATSCPRRCSAGPEEVMVGNLIQQQFQASDNWPFGAALTTAMMAFLLIWMVLYLRAAARETRGGAGVRAFDRPRFLGVFTRLFLVLLFAPIALVVLFSFNSSRSLQDFQGFSLAAGTRPSSSRSRCATRSSPASRSRCSRWWSPPCSARCWPTGSCAPARAGPTARTC